MKKTLTVIGLLSSLVVLTSGNYTDTGKVGYCGSPGEGTCQSCHNTNPANQIQVIQHSTGQQWLSNTYTPGDVYTIRIYISTPNNSSIGGFAAQFLDSAGNDAGQLVLKDPQYTELKSSTVGNNTRTTIVHKSSHVSATPGLVIYEFKWIVPNNDVGNITMYLTAVGADGDGTSSNDYTLDRTSVYRFNTPITTSVSEANTNNDTAKYIYYDLQGHKVATSIYELMSLPRAIYIVDSCGVRKKIMN